MLKKFENPVMVTRSFLPPIEEYIEELEKVWGSSWLTNNGSIHNEFEQNLSEYLKVGHVSLLTNGHLALETAIKILDLEGEIITTPFTFASTTHAIVNSGLTPVFCDIEEKTFNIDPVKIESLITERTCAIMPVHVFGNPCDVETIKNIANKYNLKVIYDAAHAFGVEVNGEAIGNYGDISMFSFHATKVFHSIEGGALTYNKIEYKRLINLYKNFGISSPEDVEVVGINAKMNEFQAAMGIINLKHISRQILIRKKITNLYKQLLSQIPGIYYIEDQDNVKHNYSYFPILVNEEMLGLCRDKLHNALKDCNIFTRKYFFPLVTDFECYKQKFKANIPIAKKVGDNVLTLPIYSSLSLSEVSDICENIQTLSKIYA